MMHLIAQADEGPTKVGTRAKITFIGPFMQQRGATRNHPCSFLLLQSGGEPLKLDYNTRSDAVEARRQLLQNPNTHSVHSLKLLTAIQKALQQALGETIPNETEVEDNDVL